MTDQTTPPVNQWKTLDKDLARISQLEAATAAVGRPVVAFGIAVVFVVICALAAFVLTGHQSGNLIIVAAAIFGAYMALNIGANDVANNMGPAVGAKALTMGGALIIAIIFETAGALIAGGDVVGTISGGIIAPEAVAAPEIFIWAMMAALIASALWLNLATWFGAPVSSTHIAVGGVFGVGFYREWEAERRARALNIQKGTPLLPDERSRRKLVRRAHVLSIAAAWVVTVPMTAGLSALLFLMLRQLG